VSTIQPAVVGVDEAAKLMEPEVWHIYIEGVYTIKKQIPAIKSEIFSL
jgi:hypothetical protein